jgi:hypothetical protein
MRKREKEKERKGGIFFYILYLIYLSKREEGVHDKD